MPGSNFDFLLPARVAGGGVEGPAPVFLFEQNWPVTLSMLFIHFHPSQGYSWPINELPQNCARMADLFAGDSTLNNWEREFCSLAKPCAAKKVGVQVAMEDRT